MPYGGVVPVTDIATKRGISSSVGAPNGQFALGLAFEMFEEQSTTMKKLKSHTIGIDSGDTILFSEYENGGDMWTGAGQRERRKYITFSEKYRSPPAVQLSPSLWDLDAKTSTRADFSVENVTKSGFDMVFRTWGDTRVARMRIAWMAIGDVCGADDWDVA